MNNSSKTILALTEAIETALFKRTDAFEAATLAKHWADCFKEICPIELENDFKALHDEINRTYKEEGRARHWTQEATKPLADLRKRVKTRKRNNGTRKTK